DAMIQTPEELARLIDRIVECRCVSLDTEFVWERTYFPRLGLVQAALPGGECVLIDAVCGLDLTPLGRVLGDSEIIKILHDAQQDLTILRRVTGTFPRHVFDTRCAAGFVGLGATVSLQELLGATLGIELSKTETRTDWLQRPLSERQISYALDDVRYLVAARDEQLNRIRRLGHERWLYEELAGYDAEELYQDRDPAVQYDRIKGSGRLSARKLAVLRELTAWREVEARRRDIPRDHLISDRSLLVIAQRIPRSADELSSLNGLPRNTVARYGKKLTGCVMAGLNLPKRYCPPTPPRHRRPNVRSLVNKALAVVRDRASSARIDPTMVVTRAELNALAHEARRAKPEEHRVLMGWRREFVGADVLELFLRSGHTEDQQSNEHAPMNEEASGDGQMSISE
ncbi:MAG: ribonuclease D, partial [Chitinivibrionales bacterium]|nr:ribonuclease D [Chitinivibrionales bacterium]